jgi:hypothetical protein
MRRNVCGTALAAATVVLTLAPAVSADCVDVGCVTSAILPVLGVVAAAGVVVAGVDVYEASVDVTNAATHTRPSRDYARFEQAWGGWQAGLGGVIAIGTFAAGEHEAGTGVVASTTFPLALAMHGTWALEKDPYGGFPNPVLAVALADAWVVGYDAERLARGYRLTSAFGIAELFGAAPQVAFGVAQAAGGRPSDIGTTLGLTALPALMAAHSVYTLVVPGPRESSQGSRRWTVTPLASPNMHGRTVGIDVVTTF